MRSPNSAEQNFKRFEAEGLKPQWRLDDEGKRYVTHYGNYIIDLAADPTAPPPPLIPSKLSSTRSAPSTVKSA